MELRYAPTTAVWEGTDMNVAKIILVAGASVMLGGTAMAADTGSSTKAKPDKQVCRKISHVGSRIGETTCMTRAEWARFDQETNRRARKTVEDTEYRNNNYVNPLQGTGN
jgi:hypothetical protein